MLETITLQTPGEGLHSVTRQIEAVVERSGIENGICNLLIQHTSASLTVQENADPSAVEDLNNWLARLVKPNDPLYTHTSEGPDDMPSHIRSALTSTTLSIPVMSGRLALGTWQGIFVWEHRRRPHSRRIVIHIGH